MTARTHDPWSDFVLVKDEAFTPEEWARIRHGTSSGYIVNGCRCDDCRAWRRDYDGRPRRDAR